MPVAVRHRRARPSYACEGQSWIGARGQCHGSRPAKPGRPQALCVLDAETLPPSPLVDQSGFLQLHTRCSTATGCTSTSNKCDGVARSPWKVWALVHFRFARRLQVLEVCAHTVAERVTPGHKARTCAAEPIGVQLPACRRLRVVRVGRCDVREMPCCVSLGGGGGVRVAGIEGLRCAMTE
eukprot:366571-Chlamydomonas_euryale.AAC.19